MEAFKLSWGICKSLRGKEKVMRMNESESRRREDTVYWSLWFV